MTTTAPIRATVNRRSLGIDVGGTKIAAGLVSSGGKLSALHIRKTPKGKLRLIKALHQIIGAYPKNLPVGLGIAGQVLPKEGLAVYSPNFSKDWKNVPIKQILKQKHHVPVAINNDAKCFAIAENVYGAGKKYSNYIALTWGTGIGGAIIFNKRIFPGAHNTAGEFGHGVSRISPGTGKLLKSDTEENSSGQALAPYYKKTSGQRANNKEIVRLWRKGNRQATRAVRHIADNFGLAMATYISHLNPEAIVVGGGLSSLPGLLEMAIKTCRVNAFTRKVGAVPIKRAKLGEYANVIGAAYIATHNDY